MSGPAASESPSAAHACDASARLRILTWHVHGNYLYSLSHLPHDIYVPVSHAPGHRPLGKRIPWGANMHEVPASRLRQCEFDCILYQSRANREEAGELLAASQRRLPSIYLEHNPPEPHAAETRHSFRHDRGLLVHVTEYNAMMWDNGDMPVRVIEHGVALPPLDRPDRTLPRGIAVVNHLYRRGRRLGADVFERLRRDVALDLIGMESREHGGLGEISNMEVARFIAQYRYFFSPVRYGSLSLALVEAMMCGLPVVGLATTELPAVVSNGVHGHVDNSLPRLRDVMRALQDDAALARCWGEAARALAERRFGIGRFVADWNEALTAVLELRHG